MAGRGYPSETWSEGGSVPSSCDVGKSERSVNLSASTVVQHGCDMRNGRLTCSASEMGIEAAMNQRYGQDNEDRMGAAAQNRNLDWSIDHPLRQ